MGRLILIEQTFAVLGTCYAYIVACLTGVILKYLYGLVSIAPCNGTGYEPIREMQIRTLYAL